MSCGCGNSGSSGACNNGCSGNCNGVPAPYYAQSAPVQEGHCVPTIVQQFVTALSNSSEFVMPACNQEAVITFPGLVQFLVGSTLWNPIYGFLLVTGFDPLSNQVTVENQCVDGNAPPGVVIPRCTLWNVASMPVNSGGNIIIMPAAPAPFSPGDPFALDVVSVVGNVITLAWHAVPIAT